MNPIPTPEHEWLHQLVGTWRFEATATGADGTAHRVTGTEEVRAVGEAWVVGEAISHEPDGSTVTNLITLGFDTSAKHFVGTYVTSMMTFLWVYRGALSADGRVLLLDTDGPDLTDPNSMASYQDRIEILDRDHRVLSSCGRAPDGSWQPFMKMVYERA